MSCVSDCTPKPTPGCTRKKQTFNASPIVPRNTLRPFCLSHRINVRSISRPISSRGPDSGSWASVSSSEQRGDTKQRRNSWQLRSQVKYRHRVACCLDARLRYDRRAGGRCLEDVRPSSEVSWGQRETLSWSVVKCVRKKKKCKSKS